MADDERVRTLCGVTGIDPARAVAALEVRGTRARTTRTRERWASRLGTRDGRDFDGWMATGRRRGRAGWMMPRRNDETRDRTMGVTDGEAWVTRRARRRAGWI